LSPISQDSRQGSVVLLGAGASADAGYPMAAELFKEFKYLLDETSEKERESAIRIRNEIDKLKGRKPEPGQEFITFRFEEPQYLKEWFNLLWVQFKEIISAVSVLKIPRLDKDGRPHLRGSVLKDPEGSQPFHLIPFPWKVLQ
jgi:hypothetical protein